VPGDRKEFNKMNVSQLLSQAEFFEGLSSKQVASIADLCEQTSCQ
jgi:hypothetical protein